MLKRSIFIILAICVLGCAAFAAEAYWTREGDLYYHAFSGCLGGEDMAQRDLSDAQAAGKSPCHICMPVSDGSTDVRAAERGNTIVLRVPDGWVEQFLARTAAVDPNEDDLMSGFMDHYIPLEYHNRIACLEAAGMLCGGSYIEFMESWLAGSAKAISHTISAYTMNPAEEIDLDMNFRHMNGAWYQVIHAYEKLGDVWRIAVEVEESEMWTEGDTLFTLHSESESEKMDVPLERMQGAKPAFTGTYDNLTLSVYDAMDAHIAVFHEPDGNGDVLENVGLDIGGHATDVLMNGYMSGKKAVFCCVLTDAEVRALEAGAAPELVRPSLADGADFKGTPYAAVHTSEWQYGIINEAGEWVIQPAYRLIDHVHPGFTKTYFLCWTQAGKAEDLTVLDGETLKTVFSLESVESFGTGMENPLLLRVYSGGDASNASYYSLETGEKLFEDNDFYNGSSNVNGRYEELAEGYPRRVVIANGAANKGAYLADDRGNPVTGEYDYIVPLAWTQGRGLFLTEQFPGIRGWVAGYLSGEIYDGRSDYATEDYLCGLMDQDGNTVAEMEYVAIDFVSLEEIHMIRADGSVTVITPADWIA